ncbi:winged helix-turn-helix transcriptional regulator [Marinithermus hydrothermalis]|uniref:Transcriptional regulator, HxlR family n=1 Tax=Marinithermus hydrothermalis (strain DSM 14884 / JCM 11576 / T1) TaxID=869210 RepID=F2NMH7_MARHT|nr:helix-turn-helix domain-containing protein [Marinithermus hydrothermalis]AEB12147.1 transcriptional regulator, HxlR family [Marinithermus hydrothermalis DSM 14884]
MADVTKFKLVLKAVAHEAGWDILNAVAEGPTRFTQLEQATRVSPRTLSERLKELTELGLIERTAYPEVPPRVEYTLTPLGQRVLEALKHLAKAVG